jgi:hypothetical protein
VLKPYAARRLSHCQPRAIFEAVGSHASRHPINGPKCGPSPPQGILLGLIGNSPSVMLAFPAVDTSDVRPSSCSFTRGWPNRLGHNLNSGTASPWLCM